jgi:hypothetical protein
MRSAARLFHRQFSENFGEIWPRLARGLARLDGVGSAITKRWIAVSDFAATRRRVEALGDLASENARVGLNPLPHCRLSRPIILIAHTNDRGQERLCP